MADVKNKKKSRLGEDGRWHLDNLSFLVDFMERANLTTGDIAELVGVSRQTGFYWLSQDDLKISILIQIFDKLGYDLVLGFRKPEEARKKPVQDWGIVMREEHVDSKRLAFLSRAVMEYGISMDTVLPEMGMGASTYYYWKRTDDIHLSILRRIAELTGLKLIINILPKEEQKEVKLEVDNLENADMATVVAGIKTRFADFETAVEGDLKGIKTAGKAARKASVDIDKALRRFRKLSLGKE